MKKQMFFAGLLSGVILAANWKTLAKGGVKAGIWTGRKLRAFSERAVEDIEDVVAEATEEMAEKDQTESDNQQ